MANKKFTTSLTIQAEKTYDCSLSKNYTDVFSINQELDNADAFVTLVSGGSSKATNTMASAKAILLKNNSNIAAELLITVMEWKDSSDTDVYNSVDLGPGSATSFRSWSFLLPAGEFMYLPNNRVLAYASDVGTAYESAAKASDGAISTEPLSINSANEYADSTADLDHATSSDMGSDVTVVDLYMEDGHSKFFKVGDLIQVDTEIMEIESLGDGSNLAKSKAVVKRGLLGSTAATHADDAAINFFFGNEHLPFDNGKCMSDKKGRFKQRGAFFSKARTSDTKVDGLVPGSVAIGPFYTEGGYLDWGLNGITPNTETGLAASTAYTFHIVVDEFHNDGFDGTSTETAIAFTTDASDTTFAGSSNAVLPKIQAVLDTQSYTTSSGLLNKKVKIFIHNGDVRVQSMSNNSDTIVGIGNVSGTTPFGVGAFPALASSVPDLMGSEHGGGTTDDIVYGPKSTLAQEEITDPITGVNMLNEKAFIFDNGNGDLLYLDKVVGKVDYEKGHCEWTVASLPEAEFKVRGQSNSAHSGGITYSVQEYNSIQEIKARSINPVKDTEIEAIVLG
jgi:hypothetical protein